MCRICLNNFLIISFLLVKLPYCSLNVLPPQITVKSRATRQSKFNMFLNWILKTYMTDVQRTSPKRPIIWPPGRPATRSCKRPVEVPIYNFWIFVFPVKNSNSCVKQRIMHRKNTFFLSNHQFYCWSPKSPLKVSWRSRTLGALGDLQRTFPERRVPAGSYLLNKL